jgi:hypothetical protein
MKGFWHEIMMTKEGKVIEKRGISHTTWGIPLVIACRRQPTLSCRAHKKRRAAHIRPFFLAKKQSPKNILLYKSSTCPAQHLVSRRPSLGRSQLRKTRHQSSSLQVLGGESKLAISQIGGSRPFRSSKRS